MKIKTTQDKLGFEFNILKAYILLGLSLLFYITYMIFREKIIHTNLNSIDLKEISPWLIPNVLNCDGIELYIMTFTMPIFLIASYYISISSRIYYISNIIHWMYYLYAFIPLLLLFIHQYYYNLTTFSFISIIVFLLGIAISYFAFYISELKFSYVLLIILNIIFFGFLIIFGILINNEASIYDYGFLIGPANKLLQGEKIGSFYILYNLITTFFVAVMLKMHFLLYQMQLIMIILFTCWIFLYKTLANKLFANNNIKYCFIIVLLLVRAVAIYAGPISSPNVTPLRMDLWVPLLLMLIYYGYESIFTSIIFSLFYLLDDVFGFLYLILYLFSISLIIIKNYDQIKKNQDWIKYLKLYIPAIIVFIFHFGIFKTIMSSSGKQFSYFHIDFSSISIFSSFWILVWGLPICLYILIQNGKYKSIILFIYGIVCIQLVYFFGRSHENNLRNISGIFILILFFTLDYLYLYSKNKQIIKYLICLGIGLLFLNYNKTIRDLRFDIKQRINNGLIYEYDIERQIGKDIKLFQSLNNTKIIFLSEYDSYLNYRIGLKQIGFYSPFQMNMNNNETVEFLYKKLKSGYRLFTYPGPYIHIPSPYVKISDCLILYNHELHKRIKFEHFILCPFRNKIMELKLVKN